MTKQDYKKGAQWLPFTPNRSFQVDPRVFVGADGMFFTTHDGRQVLDGISSLWCVALGHKRREVSEAIRKQLDTLDYSIDPERATEFYRYIRKFWPGLPEGALTPDYAGVRPKLHGAGEPQPDFQLRGADDHGLAGLMALFGIESPGLTSSLAIGEEVAARLLD